MAFYINTALHEIPKELEDAISDIEKQRDDLNAQLATTRRTTLEEAAKAQCPCCANKEDWQDAECQGECWTHKFIHGGGRRTCSAPNIRALIAKDGNNG